MLVQVAVIIRATIVPVPHKPHYNEAYEVLVHPISPTPTTIIIKFY